jgi:hypothetical protein
MQPPVAQGISGLQSVKRQRLVPIARKSSEHQTQPELIARKLAPRRINLGSQRV